jgi:hypothetical protein
MSSSRPDSAVPVNALDRDPVSSQEPAFGEDQELAGRDVRVIAFCPRALAFLDKQTPLRIRANGLCA